MGILLENCNYDLCWSTHKSNKNKNLSFGWFGKDNNTWHEVYIFLISVKWTCKILFEIKHLFKPGIYSLLLNFSKEAHQANILQEN